MKIIFEYKVIDYFKERKELHMEGVFYRDLILHDFKVDNKDDCFEKLAEILKKLQYIDDKLMFIEKLYEREEE